MKIDFEFLLVQSKAQNYNEKNIYFNYTILYMKD
jgi:hypothetical protein